jgi:hypothetical protein
MITRLNIFKSIIWQESLLEYSQRLKTYSQNTISNRVISVYKNYSPDRDIISFSLYGNRSNFNIEKINFTLLLFQAAINFHNFLKIQIQSEINRFINSVLNQDLKISKDVYFLNKILLQTKSKRLNLATKSLVINDFSDSANPVKLVDPKNNNRLRIYELLDSGNQTLNLNKTNVYEVLVKDIEIEKLNSTFGNVLVKSNLRNLLVPGEPFRYLIHVNMKDDYNRFKNIEYALLTLNFKFKKPEFLNSIKIKLASSLNVYLAKDCIKYFDGENWNPINTYNETINEDIELFFETIQTKEIKIEFKLNRWLEEKTINGIYGRIYDFSIDLISFQYSLYRDKGIFISNDYLKINELQTLKSEISYIFEDQDVFTELYLDTKLWNKYETNSNLKLSKKLPFPIKRIIKEKISFSNARNIINGEANNYIKLKFNLLFPPKETSIRIFKNGELINQELSNAIYLSNDASSSFSLLNSFETDRQRSINGELYNYNDFYIGIPKTTNIKFHDLYVIEYEVKDYFSYDEVLEFFMNTISIKDQTAQYIGYTVPILVMRNISKYNDSTSVIDKMFLHCTEKSSRDDMENLIEIEEQITNTYKGDGYVIV